MAKKTKEVKRYFAFTVEDDDEPIVGADRMSMLDANTEARTWAKLERMAIGGSWVSSSVVHLFEIVKRGSAEIKFVKK